jgi:hypothetical protein
MGTFLVPSARHGAIRTASGPYSPATCAAIALAVPWAVGSETVAGAGTDVGGVETFMEFS